jgi:hypothetical protein
MDIRVFLSRVRGVIARQQDRELAEEVRAHLDLLAAEHERRGLPPQAAREAARRDFGGVEQMKERHRDERGLPFIDTLWQDLRNAVRTLSRAPGFTATAVLLLALGMGATTAIFSVVHSVLIKPLPYPESDALVRIVHAIGGRDQTYFPTPSSSPTGRTRRLWPTSAPGARRARRRLPARVIRRKCAR